MVISPYDYVLSKKYNCNSFGSYTTELQMRINKSFEGRNISKEKQHFTVVEIIDPLKHYMKLTNPELNKISPESKKRMEMGTKIHSMAESWFLMVDDFAETEVLLDGALKGLMLTGKYDAKINGSIYELKSKSVMPKNEEDVVKHHPNDIEQVVLYSVLDNLRPKINYLVFISQQNMSDVKIFKITIKDDSKALTFAQKRIGLLSDVIKGEKDPKILGCCRHCPPKPDEDCPFYSKCLCATENKMPCGVLEFIEIEEENSKFKDAFVDSIKKTGVIDYRLLRLSDIIMPKKRLLKLEGELSDGYKGPSPEEKRNKSYFEGIVYRFNKDISKTNQEQKKKHLFKDICKYNSKFFTNKNVESPLGKWLPSINHVVKSVWSESLKKPHSYKIAELGILCLIQGYNSGFIFQFYPNLDNQCKVFKIDYNFSVPQGQEIITKAINMIKNTRLQDIGNLYDCAFGCDKCLMAPACKSK